jgi:hypothetical protein
MSELDRYQLKYRETDDKAHEHAQLYSHQNGRWRDREIEVERGREGGREG